MAITDLRNDTFFAQITLQVDGRRMEVDSRPSDAIALAVRSRVPVFVSEEVMAQDAITPEPDLEGGEVSQPAERGPKSKRPKPSATSWKASICRAFSSRDPGVSRGASNPWSVSPETSASPSAWRRFYHSLHMPMLRYAVPR